MPPEDSTYPEDWQRIADRDLGRVQIMLSAGDSEGAGFYLEQAIEKYLKAFLLSKGWRLRRTHDLEALLNDALRYDPTLEQFRPLCQEVTNYYAVERYPSSMLTGIAENDVARAMPDAKALIQHLRAGIV